MSREMEDKRKKLEEEYRLLKSQLNDSTLRKKWFATAKPESDGNLQGELEKLESIREKIKQYQRKMNISKDLEETNLVVRETNLTIQEVSSVLVLLNKRLQHLLDKLEKDFREREKHRARERETLDNIDHYIEEYS
jgi:hypothetical protein